MTWTNDVLLLIWPLETNVSEMRTTFFIHENGFENVVWEMAAILFKGRWVTDFDNSILRTYSLFNRLEISITVSWEFSCWIGNWFSEEDPRWNYPVPWPWQWNHLNIMVFPSTGSTVCATACSGLCRLTANTFPFGTILWKSIGAGGFAHKENVLMPVSCVLHTLYNFGRFLILYNLYLTSVNDLPL